MRMYDIVYQILTVDGYITKNTEKTIENARNLLSYQQNNVIALLKKIGELKSKYPVGMDIKELAYCLGEKMASPQVFALISLLASLGMLEVRLNDTIDITSLGLEYIIRSWKH